MGAKNTLMDVNIVICIFLINNEVKMEVKLLQYQDILS